MMTYPKDQRSELLWLQFNPIQFYFIYIKSQQHSPQGAVTCVETMRKANVIWELSESWTMYLIKWPVSHFIRYIIYFRLKFEFFSYTCLNPPILTEEHEMNVNNPVTSLGTITESSP